MSLQEIILTSSPEGPITAYDASSGTILARFQGSNSPRKGLTVVGKKLFAASHVCADTGAGSVQLYNWWSSTSTQTLPVPEPVAPLVATLDGSYLFAGGISGQIHALSVPSGEIIRSFAAHGKPVSCLEINYDGSLLLSGSDDGTIAVFPIFILLDAYSDPQPGRSIFLHRFIGHDLTVTGITTGMGRCNCIMISCSLDCTCKFWNLMHGTHLRTVRFPCTVLGSMMDLLESEFYAAGSDGSIYKGKLKVQVRKQVVQGEELVVWGKKHDGGPVMAMAMVNHGQILVSALENGGIWIWEVGSGNVIKVFGEEMGRISGLVVAIGCSEFGTREHRNGECSGYNGAWSWGNEINRPTREMMEMEEVLKIIGHDKSRAINNLESAIGIYEKLLKIILKEAKSGNKKVDGMNEKKDYV